MKKWAIGKAAAVDRPSLESPEINEVQVQEFGSAYTPPCPHPVGVLEK